MESSRQVTAFLSVCAFRVDAVQADRPDWYAQRTPTLFWIWHPIEYHVHVMRAVANARDSPRGPHEPYMARDLTGFVDECEAHVHARALRRGARARQDLDVLDEDWLLSAHDREVWETCHKGNWSRLAFPGTARHPLEPARLRRVLVPLVCWLAMRCSAPGGWSEEGVALVNASEALARTLAGWKSVAPNFTPEMGELAQYAATAWIETCKEVVERVRGWVADTLRPRARPARGKDEPGREAPHDEPSDTWSPPPTPCYPRRLAGARLDPFMHGVACREVPIQLVQLVDPEDGGFLYNRTHWPHRVLPLARQSAPDLPFTWGKHPCVASYAVPYAPFAEPHALCGHVQTDQPHLLVTVLIAENVPPSNSGRAVANWRHVDVCSPDVTKNVNLRSGRAQPGSKRKNPGKGNTAAGGKSQVADLLKKQVVHSFDKWCAAKEAHPYLHPVLRLVYHPSSTQNAYMFALFFAYRYLLYTAKRAGDPDVLQALKSESLWQKTINAQLVAAFTSVVHLHALCMLRGPTKVANDRHGPGCPFASYGPRVCATLDKLDPSILASSSDPTVGRSAAQPPDDWWPLMMTKKSVCRTWSDELNKYRIEQLDIDKDHPDAKQKLTSTDVTLVTSRAACMCDPWAHASVEERDDALHRQALGFVATPPSEIDDGFEWFYFQMHPREWSARTVEARLKEPLAAVPAGVGNPLAQLTRELWFLAYPDLQQTWEEFVHHKRATLTEEFAARAPACPDAPRLELHDAAEEPAEPASPAAEPLSPAASDTEDDGARRVRHAPPRCRVDPLRVDWERPPEAELAELVDHLELLATCPSTRTLAAVHDRVLHASRWPWHEWRGRLPGVAALAARFAQEREEARVLHFRLLGHQYQE